MSKSLGAGSTGAVVCALAMGVTVAAPPPSGPQPPQTAEEVFSLLNVAIRSVTSFDVRVTATTKYLVVSEGVTLPGPRGVPEFRPTGVRKLRPGEVPKE